MLNWKSIPTEKVDRVHRCRKKIFQEKLKRFYYSDYVSLKAALVNNPIRRTQELSNLEIQI